MSLVTCDQFYFNLHFIIVLLCLLSLGSQSSFPDRHLPQERDNTGSQGDYSSPFLLI